MKTLRVTVRNLRNEESFEMLGLFKAKVEKFGAARLGLAGLFDTFVPLYETEGRLLETLNKSIYTKALEASDKKRDEIYKGLYGVVKSAQKQPVETKKGAAENLFNLLKKYHKLITAGSNAEESAAIFNLLEDLAKSPYSGNVTLLGLSDWVTALRQEQQTFLSLVELRDNESAAKPKEDFYKTRSAIETVYVSSLNILDAQLIADGLGGDIAVDPDSLKTGVYDDTIPPHLRGNVVYNFIIEWNEVVKRYRNLLLQRAGRRAKKNESDNTNSIED